MPGAVAVEGSFLANRDPGARIWLAIGSARFESLETVLAELGSRFVPVERRFARTSPPPSSLTPAAGTTAPRDYELPLLLSPSEKQILDLVAAWPLMTIANATDFLGITRQGVEKALGTPARLGLLDYIIPAESRASALALSDRGLLTLARRDRLPTQHTLHHWSVARPDSGEYFETSDLRGSRMRPLLRAKFHTGMVTDFFASFHRHAREAGDALKDAEPLHRSWRTSTDRERGGGQLRPDGYAVYESKGVRVPFFLEWERRADRRSRYESKLRPYIKYYRSGRAFEDCGEWPFVLVVLREGQLEDEFWDVAIAGLRASRVAGRLRVLTSTERLVLLFGPHREIWRVTPNPWRLTLPDAAIARRVIVHK